MWYLHKSATSLWFCGGGKSLDMLSTHTFKQQKDKEWLTIFEPDQGASRHSVIFIFFGIMGHRPAPFLMNYKTFFHCQQSEFIN